MRSCCLTGVQSVVEVARRSRLRWFGHVECKSGDDWVSACRYVVAGVRFTWIYLDPSKQPASCYGWPSTGEKRRCLQHPLMFLKKTIILSSNAVHCTLAISLIISLS